jgi:hypothetical protein
MELALAARHVPLVPRCAGCGEPGSWFCAIVDEVRTTGACTVRADAVAVEE